MKKSNTYTICISALFAALTFIVTRFIQIPIPLGYFNVGNSIILLGCLLLPMPYGVAMGSLASALADLTSYPVYTLPTLIIKAAMPIVFYLMLKISLKNKFLKNLLAFSVATLIPLFGYTLSGCIIYESFITGLSQFPGLLIEYIANIVIFALIHKPIIKVVQKIPNA